MTENEAQALLQEFAQRRTKPASRTFMELSKYPHYENVCSNLLAFYLDPAEEHGLGDLLLRALMHCISEPRRAPISAASVDREVFTESGRKLDLLVITEDFVIGIENKVWAALYNDLDDYAELIRKQAQKDRDGESPRRAHRIVLSIRPLSPDELKKAKNADFKPLKASKLIREARSLLGHYAQNASGRHLFYFDDLLQTLENLDHSMKTELRDFFIKHGQEVDQLHAAWVAYKNSVTSEVKDRFTAGILGGLPESEVKLEIYQKTTLIAHIRCRGEEFSKEAVSVDLAVGSGSWDISLFFRSYDDFKFTETSKKAWEDWKEKLQSALGSEFSINDNKEDSGDLRRTYHPMTTPEKMTEELIRVVGLVRTTLGYPL